MKKYLAGLVFAALMVVPVGASAQVEPVDQAEYNVLVQQLISLLMEQVKLLQAQLDELKTMNSRDTAREDREDRDNDTPTGAAEETNEAPELAVYKLTYEQEEKTIYLRTNVDVDEVTIDGYDLSVSESREFDSDQGCIGRGSSQKCGGFLTRLTASPELEPGEYQVQIDSESETLTVR